MKMVFKNYLFGVWKQEIRNLLKKRLKLKEKIRVHNKKIEHHNYRISIIKEGELADIEKKLDDYLRRAKNKI